MHFILLLCKSLGVDSTLLVLANKQLASGKRKYKSNPVHGAFPLPLFHSNHNPIWLKDFCRVGINPDIVSSHLISTHNNTPPWFPHIIIHPRDCEGVNFSALLPYGHAISLAAQLTNYSLASLGWFRGAGHTSLPRRRRFRRGVGSPAMQ